MLGEDEPRASGITGTGLRQFPKLGIELSFGVAIKLETLQRMLEAVGDEGKDRPPVPRGARRRARRAHGIPFPKQHRVHAQGNGIGFGPGYLAKSWHGSVLVINLGAHLCGHRLLIQATAPHR